MQVFVWTYGFTCLSWVHIPQSGLAGSCGHRLNFLRSSQTVFQNHCPTHSSFPPQCVMEQISPHSCQLLLLSVFMIIAILVGVKWCLIVVLICNSLMTNAGKHIFMCLLSICISSSRKLEVNSYHPVTSEKVLAYSYVL